MSKTKIGFIGLGLMGRAMCEHLMDQGYDLVLIANRSREAIDALKARGASEASSTKALTQASDMVMLCVDTSQSVESRIYGDEGILAGLSEGQIVIDFGTSLPASTAKIGEDLKAKGGFYLDAPIGRTPAHAREGMINLMCGGETRAFEAAKPVLSVLGDNVFHLGPLGSGHKVKLINNFFGMTVANAMAEAFAMGKLMELDGQQLYDVIAAGPLHSAMMDFVKAYALDGDASKLAFAIKNASKDVGYYAQMSKDAGANSIMSQSTLTALQAATAEGRGDDMVSQMYDFYTKTLSQ